MHFASSAGSAAFQAPAATMLGSRSSVVRMDSAAAQNPANFPVKNVWTTVCSSKDLQPSSLKAAFGAGQDILVATDKGGKLFATANVCPHIGTPLDQGEPQQSLTCSAIRAWPSRQP